MSAKKSAKILTSTLLAAALMTGTTGRVSADIGDAIAGGIIGGLIVGGIQSSQRPRTQTRTVIVDSGARQQAREVQTALNHFYFNVGAPDGVLGRQSRAGISQYQAYLGFPITGQLTEFERQVLVTSYQRAQFGGPQVIQVSQSHPDGLRGFLLVVRDEMLGRPQQQGTLTAAAPVADPAPQATAAAAPVTGMPNFVGSGGRAQQASLASHCNRVGLVTSANGGYTTLGNITDPGFTLNEQFCLARGYAIADGEALMAQLGVAPQDVAAQCAGLGTTLEPQVAALSLQSREVVLAGMTQWVLTSGMSTADLATNARICLSSGYATDNLAVAIGSALILAALGETAYGELPAHHLMQGIGATQRPDLAAQWYRTSVPVAEGMAVSFQPGPADRNRLILAAVDMATGAQPAAAATQPAAPVPQPAAPAGK